MKTRRVINTQPRFGAQVAFARAATGLSRMSLGALVMGATAVEEVAARALAVKRAKIEHPDTGELEDGRLRIRELVHEETRSESWPFKVLEGHKFINLTTFRRSGEAVVTPVWFVLHDGRLYVTTPPNSGKMKRIRNNPRVVLTPCNAWGRPRGESVEGVARIIEGAASEQAEATLREKYRLGLALFHLFGKREIGQVTLEITR